MVSKIIFKKIKFYNIDFKRFDNYITRNGLFVFPAGPALALINKSSNYYQSIRKADLVFFDSGFFVLLLKVLKNIHVQKFSGYKFLSLFFNYIKKNKKKKIFCVDPNLNYSRSNKQYFKKLGIKNIQNYIAPLYDPNHLIDKKLLTRIKKFKPHYIIVNIGGGTQEILGLYLREKLKFKTTILCLGAAISFFTKDQAPINSLIDQLYLGWFIRLIFNPISFSIKYLYALRLIPMVISSKIKIVH